MALSIAAFPEELPVEVLGDVLAGADERVRAAGAILAGGHTIRDDEPKYGLAVVGTVHPDAIWPKAGAKPGDALFLTKALGTGIVLQAERDGIAPPGSLDAAIESMLELNRDAADALRPFTPNAVTDVTGFGLLGHVHELASRSGVRAVIDGESLPLLPAALELAEQGVRTGGDRRNRDYAGPHVESRGGCHGGGAGLRPADRRGPADLAAGRPWSGSRSDVRVARTARQRASGRSSRLRSRAPVVVTAVARVRTLSPGGFLRLSLASCVALFLVVTSGAFVRLTGSGPRLRQLAAVRGQALPRAGIPRVRGVREPHGRSRRPRADAGHVAGRAQGRRPSARGAPRRARRRFSSPWPRFRWARSRSPSTCTRSR